MPIATILLIVAIVLFILAATGRLNNVALQLIAAGLAFGAASVLVPMV